MLSAAQRLRRRGEFAATIRGGRRASRGGLVIHLLVPSGSRAESNPLPDGPDPTPSEPTAFEPTVPGVGWEPGSRPVRAGFVVSKAVGGAVVRNRVKRRLRHLVRDRLVGLPAGTDIVVRALPGAADRPYHQLAADLDAALAVAARHRPARRSEVSP